MLKFEEKFLPSDRIFYQRALETFPEEKGNLPDVVTEFILNIFEVTENNQESVIQTAVSFIRTWNELGYKFPQRVMDLLFYVSFKQPIFLSQLSILSSSYEQNNWLFHSIINFIQENVELFNESIAKDFPIWEFILNKFDTDFFNKSDILSIPYNERPYSFLFESILFGLPTNVSYHFNDCINSFSNFLSTLNSKVSNLLLSTLVTIFPNETLSNISISFSRLQSQSLCFLYNYNNKTNENIKFNDTTTAMKLIPLNKEIAENIINKNETEETMILKEVIEHYNNETSHVVIDTN